MVKGKYGTYKSEAIMVSHETLKDLSAIGAVTAGEMREYDAMCLLDCTGDDPEPASEKRQAPIPALAAPRK